MKTQQLVTVFSLVTAIAGASYFIDDRYAMATEFKDRIQFTNNYHLEAEIERAQDKLEGLLLIPSEERRGWQKKEIIRLENLIAKKIREKKA